MKKKIYLKVLAHILLLAVLYVLQEQIFSRFTFLGVHPVIIPVSAIGVAIFGGPDWGAGYGAAAGLLCDLAYRTLPAMAILFTAIGFFAGVLSETVMTRGFFSYLLCAAAMLVLTAVVQMFGLLLFEGAAAGPLLKTALCQTAYSALFIIPVYFPVQHISRKIRRT